MAIIKEIQGIRPQFGQRCFLSDNCAVIGDVIMGDDCSIWFNAVLRGDVNSIRLGNKVNIQDGAIVHTLYQKSKVILGNNVSVGHAAVVHGAVVADYVLIGIGAIILDHVMIGEGSIVAAGSVVLEGSKIEPGSLWAGVPAKFIKKVDPLQSKEMIEKISENYLVYASWYI